MLPYTAAVYFALLERYLADLGPLSAGAELLAIAALIAITLRPQPVQDRAVGALLAGGWLITGVAFHGLYFSGLNFLAPVYAAAFTAQGLLLAWQGPVKGHLAFYFGGSWRTGLGVALALAALAWPLLDGLIHPEWTGLRPPGLAPTPTALFTLGLLLLAERPPRHLLIIPGLWSLVAAFTGWHLGIGIDLALPLLAGAAWLALRR
jgi:hypothetical protein